MSTPAGTAVMDSRRSAACACGAFTIAVAGEPVSVHACSCFACQKRSGSAFSYTAFFADQQLSVVSGEARRWRRSDASGNAVESAFCPLCGTTVLSWPRVLPGQVGIAVGCFADPSFAAPARLYGTTQSHRWLQLPRGVATVLTQ